MTLDAVDRRRPGRAAGRARADLAANPTTGIRAAKVVKVAADGLGGFEAATETERLVGRRLVLAAGSATSSRGGGIRRALRGERVLLPIL